MTFTAQTSLGRSIANNAPGVLRSTGENLTRLNQLPHRLMQQVKLPGGDLAQLADETANTLSWINNFGKPPSATTPATTAAATPADDIVDDVAGGTANPTVAEEVTAKASDDEAIKVLRQGGTKVYTDPVFGSVNTNGLGKPGEYNLEGARTLRDVAKRNTMVDATAGFPEGTHDLSHSTLAGAGGRLPNSVYPDGSNGSLVAADNLMMKDFMQKYGGDVSKIDLPNYVQTKYLDPQLTRDPKKFEYALKSMDDNLKRLMPQAGDDPELKRKILDQVAGSTRGMVENSQEYGFLNHRNYQPKNTPTPQSTAIHEAVDSAWDDITRGYMNNNRQQIEEGMAELVQLQKREMISNAIPKEQAVELFKDHIT